MREIDTYKIFLSLRSLILNNNVDAVTTTRVENTAPPLSSVTMMITGITTLISQLIETNSTKR